MDGLSSSAAVAVSTFAAATQVLDIATVFCAGVFSAGSSIGDWLYAISGSICELTKIKVDLHQPL